MSFRTSFALVAGMLIGLLIGFAAFQFMGSANNTVEERLAGVQSAVEAVQTSVSDLSERVDTLSVAANRPTPQIRNVNEAAVVSSYYLVGFSEMDAWLTELSEAETESDVPPPPGEEAAVITLDEDTLIELQAVMRDLSEDVTDVVTLEAAFEGDDAPANVLLSAVYDQVHAVLGEEIESDTFACLSVESDIYTGSKLYVYLQVPQAQSDLFPQTWNQLTVPLEDNMFWTTRCLQVDEKE